MTINNISLQSYNSLSHSSPRPVGASFQRKATNVNGDSLEIRFSGKSKYTQDTIHHFYHFFSQLRPLGYSRAEIADMYKGTKELPNDLPGNVKPLLAFQSALTDADQHALRSTLDEWGQKMERANSTWRLKYNLPAEPVKPPFKSTYRPD
jgi:hypothetical protein